MVSSFYLPHVGGVERYVHDLSCELVKMGHEITVVTTNSESLQYHEIIDGVDIFRFPCYKIAKNRFPFLKINADHKEMFALLSKQEFDAIILNQRFYPITKLAVKLSKTTQSPLHLIEHVTGHFTVHNSMLDYFGHIYEHSMTNYLKANISKAFGVSHACNEWLTHFGIKADGVIYNGISINTKISKDYSIRGKFSIHKENPIFFHAGRLIEEKGIMIMVHAFEALQKEFKDAFLVIAGDGPLLNKINELKNENIITTGIIPHKEVLSCISESNCVVIPSFYPEGLPTLILEAGYCSTSVIATPMGGATEILDNGVNGFIVAPKSLDKLKEAMLMIIRDKEKSEKYANNLHEIVIKNFTWGKIAKTFTDNI